MKKVLVYWGVGKICEACLEQYADVIPEFFIDIYSQKKYFHKKAVKRPDEIDNWDDYYIVIVIKKSKDAEKILENKGLHKGKDYLDYRNFYSLAKPSPTESIEQIYEYKKKIVNIKPIILFWPTDLIRNAKCFSLFIKEYVAKRKPCKVILFSLGAVTTNASQSKKYDCTVFDISNICWKNSLKENKDQKSLIDANGLSEEEKKWIQELEERKLSFDGQKAMEYSQELYCYFRKAIQILCPSKIIIWGNWSRESYILGHLAEVYGIEHGYMEHGWIPGTNQFDPRGIAGQGEYAVNPDVLKSIPVNETDLGAVQQIKKYIIHTQLDTSIFYETRLDNLELEKLDSSKKTVFLIGMGETSMEINPYSEYWKRYVSDIYFSVNDVLEDLIRFCSDNDLNLIFKPHPGEQQLDSKRGHDGLIYVKDTPIDRLIQISDVAVSIASAVDYKVLIYGKPLVQVGITGLKGKGCTYEILKREDLGEAINKALRYRMTEEQQKNYDIFLARLLKKYLWDDKSEKKIQYGLTLDNDFFDIKYK